MEYFIVEGTILDAKKVTDALMKTHKAYTQKAMDSGLILMSGLKNDMSGGIFMLKSSSEQEVQSYLDNEPLSFMEFKNIKFLSFLLIILIKIYLIKLTLFSKKIQALRFKPLKACILIFLLLFSLLYIQVSQLA